jgi:hypothetical protein
MKNYDDLQRFKEKTKTLDIAFQDMSGQSQEAADKSKWSLIRQLASEDLHMPFCGDNVLICLSPSRFRVTNSACLR